MGGHFYDDLLEALYLLVRPRLLRGSFNAFHRARQKSTIVMMVYTTPKWGVNCFVPHLDISKFYLSRKSANRKKLATVLINLQLKESWHLESREFQSTKTVLAELVKQGRKDDAIDEEILTVLEEKWAKANQKHSQVRAWFTVDSVTHSHFWRILF